MQIVCKVQSVRLLAAGDCNLTSNVNERLKIQLAAELLIEVHQNLQTTSRTHKTNFFNIFRFYGYVATAVHSLV